MGLQQYWKEQITNLKVTRVIIQGTKGFAAEV